MRIFTNKVNFVDASAQIMDQSPLYKDGNVICSFF